MSPDANLYLDSMDLSTYCNGGVCELCKVDSFDELIERIKNGGVAAGLCPHWPRRRVAAFELAVKAGEVLPATPSLEMPRPVAPGLLEMNDANAGSPVLVTGNSEFTQTVMLAVLSRTRSPIKLLTVDVLGHTVDMAMVYKEFTAKRVAEALAASGISPNPPPPRVILPGLARPIAAELEALARRTVEVGPVCAAEIPLYLGDEWTPADL